MGVLKGEFMFSPPSCCSTGAPKAGTAVLGGGTRALAEGEGSDPECREWASGDCPKLRFLFSLPGTIRVGLCCPLKDTSWIFPWCSSQTLKQPVTKTVGSEQSCFMKCLIKKLFSWEEIRLLAWLSRDCSSPGVSDVGTPGHRAASRQRQPAD